MSASRRAGLGWAASVTLISDTYGRPPLATVAGTATRAPMSSPRRGRRQPTCEAHRVPVGETMPAHSHPAMTCPRTPSGIGAWGALHTCDTDP